MTETLRCSVPGGVLSSEQWRAIDELADRVADGTLRLTSRQGVQYHFLHKGDLRPLIRELAEVLVSTYAACGDVVRNVMATNAPVAGVDHDRIDRLAEAIDARFTPTSTAYWELWIDGEKAVTAEPEPAASSSEPEPEPIYGATYLPRKFKVGLAWPGDNSIDVYSQDCGIVLMDRTVDGASVAGAVPVAAPSVLVIGPVAGDRIEPGSRLRAGLGPDRVGPRSGPSRPSAVPCDHRRWRSPPDRTRG